MFLYKTHPIQGPPRSTAQALPVHAWDVRARAVRASAHPPRLVPRASLHSSEHGAADEEWRLVHGRAKENCEKLGGPT
eukprot:3684007-Pyramimonas_sp.AAC.1